MAAQTQSKASVEVVETRLGPVEVAREGSGPPVVLIHGTPGGSDSSLAMGRFLVEAGFELIAPSRPGYLGTPLGGRGTIDGQADLLAALLDELGYEQVGIVSWSGGGPSGYRLAVRHPERVAALVASAAVSGQYHPPEEDLESRLMMRTSMGNWLLRALAAHAPRTTAQATLRAEGDVTPEELDGLVSDALTDERKLEVVLTMANVVGDYEDRRAGIENDWEQFARIGTLELERIEAPTLVIHGGADSDVPPVHSERAAAAIPGADQLLMDRGTHLCLFVHPEAEAAQTRVVAKLRGW